MKKYIVIWVVTTFSSKTLVKDEFGLPDDGYKYMIELSEEVKDTQAKVFTIRDSAFAFYERGKNRLPDTSARLRLIVSPFISHIRIDSITLNKENTWELTPIRSRH